jgi:putative transposase
MTYSIDLRVRVIDYIRGGGSKLQASKIFAVNRQTIYNWLNSNNITPKHHGDRNRKIDKKALFFDVHNYPDRTLQERAIKFSVSAPSIYSALKKMKISHKKRVSVIRKDALKNA